jgi:23S rRNA (cytosine1962-C5)-methyltransferase
VLHRGKPEVIDAAWWSKHFLEVVGRRNSMFGSDTTGIRCINGESEDWPGLVLDRYGSTLVLKFYSAIWFPRVQEVRDIIVSELKPERLVLRLSRNTQESARKHFELTDGQILFGPVVDAPVEFSENGLKFEADVVRGQKTGFFLDQRENRKMVGDLAKGRRVLNCFSFSGGFSLYAARGGAISATDLDISVHALDSAKRNFALNKSIPEVVQCVHETVQADTFEWLESRRPGQFGLIVLDPPSLAKREQERAGAVQAYERLAGKGVARLERGGILVASSCSAHVSASEFFEAVRAAAKASGRRFEEMQTTGHPADHPGNFAEAHYLKTIYLRFEAVL